MGVLDRVYIRHASVCPCAGTGYIADTKMQPRRRVVQRPGNQVPRSLGAEGCSARAYPTCWPKFVWQNSGCRVRYVLHTRECGRARWLVGGPRTHIGKSQPKQHRTALQCTHSPCFPPYSRNRDCFSPRSARRQAGETTASICMRALSLLVSYLHKCRTCFYVRAPTWCRKQPIEAHASELRAQSIQPGKTNRPVQSIFYARRGRYVEELFCLCMYIEYLHRYLVGYVPVCTRYSRLWTLECVKKISIPIYPYPYPLPGPGACHAIYSQP